MKRALLARCYQVGIYKIKFINDICPDSLLTPTNESVLPFGIFRKINHVEVSQEQPFLIFTMTL